MYSAFLLVAIWLFLLGLSGRQQEQRFDRDFLAPLMFVAASILVTNASYLLIISHSSPRLMNHLLLGTSIGLAGLCLVLPGWRQTIAELLGRFLLPRSAIQTGAAKAAIVLRSIRVAMVAFTALLMLTIQLLSPTLGNWDSNWYNVSRIPAMVLTHTTFPESAPVPFQALYPLAHDLLYLFDISMLSLRGMGIICILEYFVILGCLYKIACLLLANQDRTSSETRSQFALLLITALFISSDLQLYQAVETKNDLAMSMCFTINTMLCIDSRQRQERPLHHALAWLLVGAYALASKSYGIIAFLPPLVTLAIDSLQLASASRRSQASIFQRLAELSHDLWLETKQMIKRNGFLSAFLLCNVLLLLGAWLGHGEAVRHSARAKEFQAIITAHANVGGSLLDRLTIFCLNSIRNAISILMYPYTTLRKLNASRPDDYFFGFGPLNAIINDPRGVMGTHSIVRNVQTDSSHGSIFLLPLALATIFLYLTSRLAISKRNQKAAIIVLASCVLAFGLLSFALLSNSWLSKYMGSTYIPLIPLLSVAASQPFRFHVKRVMILALAICTFSFLRPVFLLNTSEIPKFASQAWNNPKSLHFYQSTNLFYYWYAGSRYRYKELEGWLNSLHHLKPGKIHAFCYGHGTPTLTPLMHAMQSLNQNANLEFRLVDKSRCIESSSAHQSHAINYNFIDLF